MEIKLIKDFKVIYYQIAKEVPEILGSGSDFMFVEEHHSYDKACEAYNPLRHNSFECLIYCKEFKTLRLLLDKEEKDVFKNIDWYTTYLFYPKTNTLCRVTTEK